MSLQHSKSKRRMLPRWRVSGRASHGADFAALRPAAKQPIFIGSPLSRTIEDFESAHNIGTAAELLSSSLLAGVKESADTAAQFILAHENEAPRALVRLATSITTNTSAIVPQALNEADQVRQTKRLLKLHPDNPMLWSDLSRHFSSHGEHKRAGRCMKVALQLAPDHRWMLRTVARFLVHQDDPLAAHKLLANHPRTRHDPWLIAAELACAHVAGRPPKYWRQANDILRFNAVAPLHISELATAVAMMELESGERKKARRHIQRGLEVPTENALAQVFWAKENNHLSNGYELDQLVRTAEGAYEADYRLNLLQGDIPLALKAAATWANDESFAARPRAEIAFIASLLDDHDLSMEMTRAVHRLQGHADPTLEMNAIFATLSSGKLTLENDLQDLEKLRYRLLRTIDQGNDIAYHAMANLGLWHYRYGDRSLGRELYQKAIGTYEKLHMLETAALAATFAAREAILARDPKSDAVLLQAKELAKRSKNTASDFYLRKLDALIINPEKAKEILSPSFVQNLPRVQKKTPAFRIEKDGDRLVVVFPARKT